MAFSRQNGSRQPKRRFGKSTPIYFLLTWSFNKDLEVINSSYWNFKRIDPGISGSVKPVLCLPADAGNGFRDEPRACRLV